MTTKRRVLSGLFALALLATTAVGVAESRKGEATMSDLAMANIEALATPEQPNVDDCKRDPYSSCEALHPTDPSKDKTRPEAKW